MFFFFGIGEATAVEIAIMGSGDQCRGLGLIVQSTK
jgi:hypothetical protein